MHKEAIISKDQLYRYALVRSWDKRRPRMTFIGLNPSIADDVVDTPTMRRCIAFAKREGMGGIHVVNLYAYRTSNPKELPAADEAVGPSNYFWLRAAFQHNGQGKVVAMWGTKGDYDMIDYVRKLSEEYKVPIFSFGRTKSGAPRHPLYTPSDQALERWY